MTSSLIRHKAGSLSYLAGGAGHLIVFQHSLANLKGNYQLVEETLPKLTMPALVLWGAQDPFFAVAVGQRVQQALPNATLQVYEQTGHFVPEERPAWVVRDLAALFAKGEAGSQ